MRQIIISIILFFVVSSLFAQQQEHYSMYMMNNYMINPAEGGTEEFVDIKAGYRNQWTAGFDGNAPKTIFVSGHAPVGKQTSRFDDVDQLPFHGAGGVIIQDKIHKYTRTVLKASYAYHLPISKDLVLSAGAFVGIVNYAFDVQELSFTDSDDEADQDPVAGAGSLNSTLPDASLGLWGYGSKYYFGVTAFQLVPNKNTLLIENGSGLKQHYFITGGYRIPIGENFNLIPSVQVKKVAPAPWQLDLNAKFRYQDLAWVGASWRNGDAIIGLVGVTIKKLIDVGYSYDFTTTDIKDYSNGSHEVIVGLRLPNHEHEPPPAQFW